jgi:hypothetical protein
MTIHLQTDIQAGLGSLFCVATHRDLIRIRTPFWYPDGGVVDLFLKEHDGRFTLTDLGEALGWLRAQSLTGKRSAPASEFAIPTERMFPLSLGWSHYTLLMRVENRAEEAHQQRIKASKVS